MRHAFKMLVCAVLTLCVIAPARAEVKKLMLMCDGKLCPHFEVLLTPPEGWTEDKAASKQNKVQVVVPKGKNFGSAEALIYVKTSYKTDKAQPLADFIRVSQERWKQNVPDTKISKLADVTRANNKPAFESYRYDNPSKPEQAFEIVSFGMDTDRDGNDFVLMVMTGRAKKALEQAEKPYQVLLRTH